MNISIIGAGAWGLALAQVLADNNIIPRIYAKEQTYADAFNTTHHSALLPGDVMLDERLCITTHLEEAVVAADVCIIAVPTNAVREVLMKMRAHMTKPAIIVNVAKGIEINTHLRISQIAAQVLSETEMSAFVSLTGPSHAEEVAIKQLTTIVAASENKEAATRVQQLFTNDTYFRVYTTDDVIGAEVGGALKNVIALAAGYLHGKGYGDNPKAALLTRGIAEMTRFGIELGAKPLTFAGLTGIGDLIVTATSHHSRNFQAGLALAKGISITEIKESKTTIEGIKTACAAYELSKELHVEMPITEFIYHVIQGTYTADDFSKVLLAREVKSEIEVHNHEIK